MGSTPTQITSDQAPSLGLFGSPASGIFRDPNGGPDAQSLCLTVSNSLASELSFATFPWTEATTIANAGIIGSPAMCTAGASLGHVWVWNTAPGTGLSWYCDGPAGDGVQKVPHHAHSASSPAIVMAQGPLDPLTGQPFTEFAIFWQGDATDGGSGTEHSLWSMSYGPLGWSSPYQIAGAQPGNGAYGAPAVALMPGANGIFQVALAWTDRNGQIFFSTTGAGELGGAASWTTPVPGPPSCTAQKLGLSWFDGYLIVAWTITGRNIIVYAAGRQFPGGGWQWSSPTRLCDGHTAQGPALAAWGGALYAVHLGLTTSNIYYESFASFADLPAPNPAPGLLLRMSFIADVSKYCAEVFVGSALAPISAIIDTGSSAFGVDVTGYIYPFDSDLKVTSFAGLHTYGGGRFWLGPVVETTLSLVELGGFGVATEVIQIPAIGVGLSQANSPTAVFNSFQGIMGFGYLHTATAFSEPTVPWTLTTGTGQTAQSQFNAAARNAVSTPFPAAFSQIVQEGRMIYKFGFWVARSAPSFGSADPPNDPLNAGYLVLGGGQEFFIGRVGRYQTVPITYGGFYYLNLISAQLGTPSPSAPVPAPSAAAVNKAGNVIVDTGTNALALNGVVYQAIIALLGEVNPSFAALIVAGTVPNEAIIFAEWPPVILNVQGENGETVSLVCTSEQYWQTDAPVQGIAQFMLNQSSATSANVFGLALLSGYYTVFDRSGGGTGTISFARTLDFPSTLELQDGPITASDPPLNLK